MKYQALLLICVMVIIPCGCATNTIYPSVEASLTDINQKVSGHFLLIGIPDGFDKVQYRKAVEDVCYTIPACKTSAEDIFNIFDIQVRKLDGMFSVMLCDKTDHWKVMEDLSCNNRRVEIQNWKNQEKMPCDFEPNWSDVAQKYCYK